MTILPTRNPAWGFAGTIERSGIGIDTSAAWTLASTAIARAARGSAEAVRDFLDSRDGRHFADDVVSDSCANAGSNARSTLRSSAGWAGVSAGG